MLELWDLEMMKFGGVLCFREFWALTFQCSWGAVRSSVFGKYVVTGSFDQIFRFQSVWDFQLASRGGFWQLRGPHLLSVSDFSSPQTLNPRI